VLLRKEGDMENYLEDLIRQAHSLYGETTIFEVIDADMNTAVEWMVEMYGPPVREKLEKYFLILDQIREFQNPPGAARSWAEQKVRTRLSGWAHRPT
jgi:hypothetical protein